LRGEVPFDCQSPAIGGEGNDGGQNYATPSRLSVLCSNVTLVSTAQLPCTGHRRRMAHFPAHSEEHPFGLHAAIVGGSELRGFEYRLVLPVGIAGRAAPKKSYSPSRAHQCQLNDNWLEPFWSRLQVDE
jgi:hypothetical protein